MPSSPRLPGARRPITDARGFTLVEVLVATVLFGILVTLGGAALRHYWLVQSLEGATDEVTTYLKRAHTRSTSESHPRVYGAWFELGGSEYRLVLFDPESEAPVRCSVQETRALGAGMFGSPVRVSEEAAGTTFASTPETDECRSLPGASGAENQFVFFYARGTATPGQVTLEQPTLDRTRTITVSELTGRVDAP